MNVYVASLWYEYSDPFATIIGTSASVVQDQLNEIAAAEASALLWEDASDNICSGGIPRETFLVNEPFVFLPPSISNADLFDALATDGYLVV